MNRKALDKFLAQRRKDADWTTVHDALAAVARTLADTLDAGAGVSVAPVARELRTTIDQLRATEGTDAFDRLAAELSAAVEYRKG